MLRMDVHRIPDTFQATGISQRRKQKQKTSRKEERKNKTKRTYNILTFMISCSFYAFCACYSWLSMGKLSRNETVSIFTFISLFLGFYILTFYLMVLNYKYDERDPAKLEYYLNAIVLFDRPNVYSSANVLYMCVCVRVCVSKMNRNLFC